VEPDARRVRVILGGETIADTTRALRVLETSHPPTFYLPREDVAAGALVPAEGSSFCEWKGRAAYLDVVGGGVTAPRAAWYYPDPVAAFAALRDHVAFYPGRMDACLVGDERARAQEGDFYGGWITDEIAGPFKGAPGTRGW
jgi:uncharacterized protein (DUF427 family)